MARPSSISFSCLPHRAGRRPRQRSCRNWETSSVGEKARGTLRSVKAPMARREQNVPWQVPMPRRVRRRTSCREWVAGSRATYSTSAMLTISHSHSSSLSFSDAAFSTTSANVLPRRSAARTAPLSGKTLAAFCISSGEGSSMMGSSAVRHGSLLPR